MNHSNFLEKYNSNQIVVHIDKNKAGFMYQNPALMPKKYRSKQVIARLLAFVVLIVAVALFFFVPWWAALGVLFMAFALFPRAQKQASEGVLAASLEDPNIYQIAVDNGVLVIKKQT